MMNPRNSESFAPVVLSLAVLVVSPALAPLVPTELVTTLMATPLRRAVSAALLLVLMSGVALWIVSRVSVQMAAAAEGGNE